MAYASLVSLSQTIHKLLQNDKQDSTSLHEKQQIKRFHEHITFLETFLEDFPEKANNLEARIRDVANEAEDIIETFMLKEIHSSLKHGKNSWLEGINHMLDMVSLCYDFQTLNQELQKATEEIESIAREVKGIKYNAEAQDVQVNDSSTTISSTIRKVAPVIGFDEYLMAIKDCLCGESSKLQVIPILGMGGIGKTTLAKSAFDDPLIVEHFDVRVWVTISQNYSAQEILSGLLASIEADRSEESDESQMRVQVYKSLKGRRYLIVTDDMWRTQVWDGLRLIFPDDRNGSRVMLTTRLADVAAYPDPTSRLHEIHCLNADQSWNLLQHKVFPQQVCPPELEFTGKMIASNCRGLPLAIVLIGGILTTAKRTRASWESIARNVNLAISTTNDEQFGKILSLSYNHLSHHLRPCFLYMGSFPEDYKFHVSKLIKLWVAEGFLRPSGSRPPEDVALENLEDLVKRSLVTVDKRKANGKIKSCSVHDLLRDLCIRKACEEKFILNARGRRIFLDRKTFTVDENLNSIENVFGLISLSRYRAATAQRASLDFLNANDYSSTVRTIICSEDCKSSSGFLAKFGLLRVFDVVNIFPVRDASTVVYLPSPWQRKLYAQLPSEVFKLFHLRYFAIMYPVNFPRGISNLQNLQTLIMGPKRLPVSQLYSVRLPAEIWSMPRLRHLISASFGNLPDPREEDLPLLNLQTLSKVENFICSEKILRMIPNLKKLGISYSMEKCSDEGNYIQDYLLRNLVYLPQLEKLKLEIVEDFPFREKLGPVFPRTLTKLALSGRLRAWEDIARIFSSLPNLEVLKLRNNACNGKWETIEGEFPQLQYLLIHLSDIQEWTTESSHFPRLRCLVLYNCMSLSDIPDGIGEIPTLELIEVDNRNISLLVSAERILEEQQSYGNDDLKVHIVHRFGSESRPPIM